RAHARARALPPGAALALHRRHGRIPTMSTRCIDLSLPLENYSMDRDSPHIFYWDHHEGGRRTAKNHGFNPDQIPDGFGLSAEDVTLNTHTGTHLDAPWHYGPTVAGKRAYGIDEVPLEWCFSDGVVLDLTHRKAGELITA